MLVVVVFGLLRGGVRLKRRLDDLAGRADFYDRMTAHWIERGIAAGDDPLPQRFIVHYASLARTYWHATRYPWLPVELDPPEPPGRHSRKR
jgi:hypothetical protein